MQVAGNAKTRAVRLGFGQWPGLPKWECWGVGGWDCKNKGSEAHICENKHAGAHYRKSESSVMARPAKMGMLQMARNAKTRTVGLRFAKMTVLHAPTFQVESTWNGSIP